MMSLLFYILFFSRVNKTLIAICDEIQSIIDGKNVKNDDNSFKNTAPHVQTSKNAKSENNLLKKEKDNLNSLISDISHQIRHWQILSCIILC